MLAHLLTQLAEADVDANFIKNALLFILFISQVATGWALISGKGQKREITPQPLEVRPTHEPASKAAFEDHKKEIWTVINGIRRDITEAREDIAAVRVAREENAGRLKEIGAEVSTMSKTLNELRGEMNTVAENVRAAATTANQAAATAQAALVEAQHKSKS